MRRFPIALVTLLLVVSACTAAPAAEQPTTSSPPKGDLAVLAERIAQRRAELGTAAFHTEGFASDGQATKVRNVVDGVVRQGADGVTGAMTMDVSTGGQPKKIALVLVRDGTYVRVEGAPMPAGKTWGFYPAASGGEVAALLRGFGPSARPGAELDYVQPRAALIVGKSSEQVDGVPTTRFDLVVDALKMAKVVEDQDIQLQHTQLAQYGVRIAATVWVDGTSAPVRAEYRFELDGKVVKQSTTRFRGWGEPVTVTVPQPAEVVPADQLPR
ncbi:hypothetical protein ACIGNX_19815 [Actinosynnema sp. NPDC053489]|uniref:hypothetical protein n=1 Tax=Actinosynnema sp. NPDC053489 TaxID=3363916 RepID=UPI0037C83317